MMMMLFFIVLVVVLATQKQQTSLAFVPVEVVGVVSMPAMIRKIQPTTITITSTTNPTIITTSISRITTIPFFRTKIGQNQQQQHQPQFVLGMGLYDKPLPSRRPRKDNKDDEKNNMDLEDDEEEDDDDIIIERLFQFNISGKEINNLLPPLQRQLTSMVGCYYEPTDRIVQNLVDKTKCHYLDACWALEACQGDITEAWTRISVARRMQLNDIRKKQIMIEENIIDDREYEDDQEIYDTIVQDEYQQRKMAIQDSEKQRRKDIYNTPSKPDDPWLPIKNPTPNNDEPWFTG